MSNGHVAKTILLFYLEMEPSQTGLMLLMAYLKSVMSNRKKSQSNYKSYYKSFTILTIVHQERCEIFINFVVLTHETIKFFDEKIWGILVFHKLHRL